MCVCVGSFLKILIFFFVQKELNKQKHYFKQIYPGAHLHLIDFAINHFHFIYDYLKLQ